MQKPLEINDLAQALSKAQGSMKPAEKTGFNTHRKYNYVELSGIVDAARKPLADNGLAVTQTFEDSENSEPILITRLMHTSGQYIESKLRLLPVLDYHALGSACTYSRKYALAALLGIVAEGEDDDGEAAMPDPKKAAKPSAGTKARPTRKKKAPPSDPYIDALAIIDKTEGARAMFEAKDIDCRELLPQLVEKINAMGAEGMAEKVADWRKEEAKKEAEAEKETAKEEGKA
jgi:hypothetical protein